MASVLSGFILFLFVIYVRAENTKQILPEAVVSVRPDYNVAVFYRMLTQKVIIVFDAAHRYNVINMSVCIVDVGGMLAGKPKLCFLVSY